MKRKRLQLGIAIVGVIAVLAVVVYLAFGFDAQPVADYGGTYVEGVVGNPRYMNPLLCQSNSVDCDIVALVFTGLTTVGNDGVIEPDLAESWDISTDSTVYTFYLRQDAVWHDGAPVTAADVVYTVSIMQDSEFQGDSFLSEMWQTVVVDQIDEYTVRFTLREPFSPFLEHTTIGLLPSHILANVSASELGDSAFNASPIGTGPFKMSQVSATEVELVANSDYYNPRPYLDSIVLKFYSDYASLLEARERGEIAGMSRVQPEQLEAVAKDDDLTLYSAPLSGYTLVYLNLDRPAFQDPAVRQALMYALDRQALVDDIVYGQGIVIDTPIMPHSWAFDDNLDTYNYNQNKAISLLEQSGWFDDDGDGIRERGTTRLQFILSTNEDDSVRVAIVDAIARQLAEVGIAVVPDTVSWTTLVDEMLRPRAYDAVLLGWQDLPPDPDPYPYWHSSQATQTGLNFANYISSTADALLQQARATTDQDERYELYRSFQALFVEDVPSVVLYQPVYTYAVDSGVYGVQVAPMTTGSDRFANVASWYMATQRLLDE